MPDMHNDIAAAKLLGMGAMHYAGKAVTATIGTPPPGSSALAAIDRVRHIITGDGALPVAVKRWPFLLENALRDLQMAAILFTVQLAISDGHDESALRSIKDHLVAMLAKDPRRWLHVHDEVTATQRLGDRALDYARQVILAEDTSLASLHGMTHAPIGSEPMERAIVDLQVAAVALTAQLAISEGHDHDPKLLRKIEAKLITMITQQEVQ